MRTRCPECQTVFRVTPEQLKARAGKVRCGHCHAAFNALDSLLDGPIDSAADEPVAPLPLDPAEPPLAWQRLPEAPVQSEPSEAPLALSAAPDDEPLNEQEALAAQEAGKASGFILPRDTTEIPGYSKWSEGVMAPAFAPAEEKPSRRPFALAAIALFLVLFGQAVFHFRSELALASPSLRPALEALAQALGASLPLPAHAELISIESSDLQTDASRGNFLVLNATLRNHASFAQAFPTLELSLTDTQDNAIARRTFSPKEYLPAKAIETQALAANSDEVVRLWLEVSNIDAAGYRLFVFYP